MTIFSVTGKQPHNFVIEVFRPNLVHTCAVVTRALRSGHTKVPCRPGVIGSVVKIKMTGIKNSILALREVEVFGIPGESIRL